MIFFNKKPKLEFVCLIPEVAKSMPIEPASKSNFHWSRKMIESFKEIKEKIGIGNKLTHVAKCPGISLISNQGWIQRNYQDIYIKTDSAGGISWKTPLDQTNLTNHDFNYPYVSFHSRQDMEPYNLLKPSTFHSVIKIQSPWVVKVPKGYYLLCSTIPYNDDNRFTASMGIIDGDAGINFLNIQLFWHILEGEEIIKAGTPLAQYFLIKKEKTETVSRSYNDTDLSDLRYRRLILETQFLQNYSHLKKD